MTIALLAVAVQFAACLGLGALALRALGLFAALPPAEHPSWAFALGFGLLSLLVFPLALAGMIANWALAALLGSAALGVFALPREFLRCPARPSQPLTLLLLCLLALVLGLYLAGALVPPADGDSMAYHFARIKQIAQQGRLTFLPQAVEGAAPMMAHMTYLPVYILGGEQALTLWTTASGLMTSFFLFTVALRWLEPAKALLLALLLLTTPAAVFGTGSGQVEMRNAQFVLMSALAIMEGRRTGSWRWQVLAGIGCGLFAGSKVFGLIWLGAGGLVTLAQRRWFRSALVFGLAALLTACPWYLWNLSVSGDPLFPMLQWVLGLPDGPLWTLGHLDLLVTHLKTVEQPVPPTLDWFLAYPFLATLHGQPMWEAGRTGLGVFGLLALPFALAGAWRRQALPGRSPLWTAAWLIFLFYSIWFFFGTAQRVRHLLPLYPLLLLLLGVASLGRISPRPLLAGALAVIVIQIGGLGLFQLPAVKAWATGESRAAFLEQSIPFYPVVTWINEHLGPHDRLLLGERQLLYHIDVPYFFAHVLHQAQIDLRPDAPDDIPQRWAAMRRLGVTHVMLTPELANPDVDTALQRTVGALLAQNCLRLVHRQTGQVFVSRTLSSLARFEQEIEIYALTPFGCALEQALPNRGDPATTTQIHKDESHR